MMPLAPRQTRSNTMLVTAGKGFKVASNIWGGFALNRKEQLPNARTIRWPDGAPILDSIEQASCCAAVYDSCGGLEIRPLHA